MIWGGVKSGVRSRAVSTIPERSSEYGSECGWAMGMHARVYSEIRS